MNRVALPILASVAMLASAAAFAADRTDRLAAGDANARELLTLMDIDKSGKVSKAEWMRFMEQEFDRLDANHDGELDVDELTKFLPRRGIGAHR